MVVGVDLSTQISSMNPGYSRSQSTVQYYRRKYEESRYRVSWETTWNCEGCTALNVLKNQIISRWRTLLHSTVPCEAKRQITHTLTLIEKSWYVFLGASTRFEVIKILQVLDLTARGLARVARYCKFTPVSMSLDSWRDANVLLPCLWWVPIVLIMRPRPI